MRTTSITHRLSDSAPFAKCDRQDRDLLDRIGTQVRRPAGTVLAREGARADQYIVVLEGIATAHHPDGAVELTAGSTVGACEITQRKPHAATIVAETAVVLEVLSLREFATLLNIVPTLATALAFAE